jgi:hypothetical protein
LAFFAGIAAVLLLILLRNATVGWAGFVVGSAVVCLAVPPNWPSVTQPTSYQLYQETVRAARFIDQNIRDHHPRFWYDNKAATKPTPLAIASTYFWGMALINEQWPRLTADEVAGLPADTRLVILLPEGGTVDAGRTALRGFGADLTVVNHQIFGSGNTSVQVVVADLLRTSGASRP